MYIYFTPYEISIQDANIIFLLEKSFYITTGNDFKNFGFGDDRREVLQIIYLLYNNAKEMMKKKNSEKIIAIKVTVLPEK